MSRGKYGTDGDNIQAQLDALKAEVTGQVFAGLSGRINELDRMGPDQLRARVEAHAGQNQAPSVFETIPTGSTITPPKLPLNKDISLGI